MREQLVHLFVDAVTEEPVESVGMRQEGVDGAIEKNQVRAGCPIVQVGDALSLDAHEQPERV